MESTKEKSGSIIFYISLMGFFGIFTTTISKNPVLPYLVKARGIKCWDSFLQYRL